jgi:DNA (cytosine-5)-methyltransferase 1
MSDLPTARPKLLDLFCGAGGAGMGYYRAGFAVYGIDNKPQPHYLFPFLQMDAIEAMDRLLRGEGLTFSNGETLYLADINAFHASPPCQRYSAMTKGRWQDRLEKHPDLIEPTRQKLILTSKPYVIENVAGAKDKLINPIMLCGTMFRLETKEGNQLRRHRYFETSWIFNDFLPQCQHNNGSAVGVYGGRQNPARRKPATIGKYLIGIVVRV